MKENFLIRAARDAINKIFPGETFVLGGPEKTGPGFDSPMLQPKGSDLGDRQVADLVEGPVQGPQLQPRQEAPLGDRITKGLEASGFANAPIASEIDAFVEAGEQLGERDIEPLLPVIVALMESGGGRHVSDPSANNPFNLFRPGTEDPAQFASFRESLFGPEGSGETLNLLGLLRENGLYQEFLETGDVSKFFEIFTPESDPRNPTNKELVGRFEKIRANFE